MHQGKFKKELHKNLEKKIYLCKEFVLLFGFLFSEEAVEPLEIPNGVAAGDRISVDGYSGTPDDQLNPKKKVWENLQVDLKTNGTGEATWKDNFLLTSDGQKILAGLKNCSIK